MNVKRPWSHKGGDYVNRYVSVERAMELLAEYYDVRRTPTNIYAHRGYGRDHRLSIVKDGRIACNSLRILLRVARERRVRAFARRRKKHGKVDVVRLPALVEYAGFRYFITRAENGLTYTATPEEDQSPRASKIKNVRGALQTFMKENNLVERSGRSIKLKGGNKRALKNVQS